MTNDKLQLDLNVTRPGGVTSRRHNVTASQSPIWRVEGLSPFPSQSGRLPNTTRKRSLPSRYLEHTANLDGFAPVTLYPKPIVPCKLRYIVTGCGCNRYVQPSVCMSLTCPTCAPWTGKRRAFSIFNRFVPVSGQSTETVIYTSFTVPPEARARFIDPKEWQKVRKKAWQILKSKFGGLYGVECSHPHGDHSDVFHPHLNFLWRQKKNHSPYIDVGLLRTAWAEVLHVNKTVAYSRYSQSNAKIMHWSKYISRVFVGLHGWTGPVRWYGKYPKKEARPEITCMECGQPFRAIGYLAAEAYESYAKFGHLMGLDPPWNDDKRIQKFKSNPLLD